MAWYGPEAAEPLGISRPTAQKWLARWHRDGHPGLTDPSSRPRHSPRRVPAALKQRILAVRRRLRVGPRRFVPDVGRARTTIYTVLRRDG